MAMRVLLAERASQATGGPEWRRRSRNALAAQPPHRGESDHEDGRGARRRAGSCGGRHAFPSGVRKIAEGHLEGLASVAAQRDDLDRVTRTVLAHDPDDV